jgi:hypothetical protein
MAESWAPSFQPAGTLTSDHCGIGEVSIPILGHSFEGAIWASGTAVVIAPSLAMTARHVVDDYLNRFGCSDSGDGTLDPKFRLLSYIALQGGEGLITLAVGRIWHHPALDIALLELLYNETLPKNHRWNLPKLALSPPRRGSAIAVFGYPSSSIELPQSESVLPTWQMHPRISTGTVQEIHPQCRDTCLLPFPCFRTNARFDGGTSGAPVFNEDGDVCGIVCSSMPPMQEEDGHVSYASLLWPAMGISIDLPWSKYPAGYKYPLYELASAGHISTQSLDRVQILKMEQDQIRVRYYERSEDL